MRRGPRSAIQITNHPSLVYNHGGVGRRRGVGRGLGHDRGVGRGLGVGRGVALRVGVGVGVPPGVLKT